MKAVSNFVKPQNLRWKRILLIKPNCRISKIDIHYTRLDVPPLNLTYIASYLIDLEITMKIIDAKAKNLNYRQIKKEIQKFNPDLVGISVFITAAIKHCYDIARIVKEVNPKCLVVFGGRHPTFEPEETLKVDEVDLVVRGEGELTLRELIIKGNLNEIKGISYKSDGKIIHNPDRVLIKDFGKIRYPARHLVKKNKYHMLTARFETVQTSRGCPHKCKFCSTPIFNKGLWRPRPVEKIIIELKMISQNRRIRDIFFIDENFAVDTKRIEKLCEKIIECRKKKEISDFKFFAQLRVDDIARAPKMVKAMADAGFWLVFVGVETVNEDTLNDMRKGFTFNKTLKAIKLLHKYNIMIFGNWIIGLNLDATKEDIKKEIEFIKKLDIDLLTTSILTPFPGTIILKEFKEKNLLVTKDWSKYTIFDPVIKTNKLSSQKLQDLFFSSYKAQTNLKKLKGSLPRLIKARGILFFLNPKRFISIIIIFIKIRIIIRKFNN